MLSYPPLLSQQSIKYCEGLKDKTKCALYTDKLNAMLHIHAPPHQNISEEMATLCGAMISAFDAMFAIKEIHHFNPLYKLRNSPQKVNRLHILYKAVYETKVGIAHLLDQTRVVH